MIDIIVPTLGTRPLWLRLCLRSIVDQGSGVRVTVVAPASREVDAICEEFQAERLTQTSRGLSRAINMGFSAVASDSVYVTWLGDDDVLAPGSVSLVREALDRNPDAPFAYGRVRYIDGEGATLYMPWSTRLAWRTLSVGQDHIAQPGSLVRAEALRSIGFRLDDNLANAMDLDMFLRLRALGRPVYVAHEVAAYRLHGGSITISKGNQDEGEAVRARYRTAWLNRTSFLWRPPMRLLDWLFVSTAWRMHKPSESGYFAELPLE